MTRSSRTRRGSIWEEAAIREFIDGNSTSEQSGRRTISPSTIKELLRNIQGLELEDQTKIVDRVDQMYTTIDSQNAKLISALGEACSVTEQLPTPAVLSTELKKCEDIAVASGGLTDIWRGEFSGLQVAIKAFRISAAENLRQAKKILWQRVPIWRKLSHENILLFHGVNTTLFRLGLIYDWGKNRNISQYIALNPDESRPSLLFDVAKGLEYLHSFNILHGGLRGTNVIVDQRGRARLTEYGLAPINLAPDFTVAATPEVVGTSRWLAPEIINPTSKDNDVPAMESKAADVFSFAMLAVEVFTGKVPFENQKDEAVMSLILGGDRPGMPENAQAVGLTDEMWKHLERCWQQKPRKRPTMEDVVKGWSKFIGRCSTDNSIMIITEEPRYTPEPTPGKSRPRASSEAVRSLNIPEIVRFRKTSEGVRPRTGSGRSAPVRRYMGTLQMRTMSETAQPRTMSETTQPRTSSETIRPRTGSGRSAPVRLFMGDFQTGTTPEAVQSLTSSVAVQSRTSSGATGSGRSGASRAGNRKNRKRSTSDAPVDVQPRTESESTSRPRSRSVAFNVPPQIEPEDAKEQTPPVAVRPSSGAQGYRSVRKWTCTGPP